MEASRFGLEKPMTIARLSFSMFMLACVVLFTMMGVWQVRRLHWKEGLITAIDREYAHRVSPLPVPLDRVQKLGRNDFIRGSFQGKVLASQAFNLQGQIDEGRQTSHLMLPLRISEKTSLLIDMGPDFDASGIKAGQALITGLLKQGPQRNPFTPSNDPSLKIWFSIEPRILNIPDLQNLVILPEHTPWKDFPVRKPELRNAHLQYAIFWFTLAALIAGMTGYYLFYRPGPGLGSAGV